MGGVEGDNGMHIPQNTGQIVCMMELSLHCNVANPSSFSCLQLSTWSRHGGVGNHDDGDGGVLVEGEVPATTGSHCGGHAAGFLVPDCVLATPCWSMCGMTWAQMAAAAPRRTNARKREACFFACRLKRGSRGWAWVDTGCSRHSPGGPLQTQKAFSHQGNSGLRGAARSFKVA